MQPAFPTSDYYGSSATPRRQQRTVRLPRARRFGGHRRDASHVHHQPVDRVGAQLYPGDIAARCRNTPRGLARPSDKRAGETALSSNEDQASQQPIAASFGAAVQYRGFHHWFGLPTPFCLATAPGPLAADRCSIVRGCSRPPPNLRDQAALRLHPTVTAVGVGPFTPTRLNGASWRSTASDEEKRCHRRGALADALPDGRRWRHVRVGRGSISAERCVRADRGRREAEGVPGCGCSILSALRLRPGRGGRSRAHRLHRFARALAIVQARGRHRPPPHSYRRHPARRR